MKRNLFIALSAVAALPWLEARADEGMWPIERLSELAEAAMTGAGCHLSAADIFNAKGNALSDAIIIFGGGCTGEFVSDSGLVFTNHHCGYSSIQQLSSLQHNYLHDGYYAPSRLEELPAPGLEVRRLVAVDDITEQIVGGLSKKLTPEERKAKVSERTQEALRPFQDSALETKIVSCSEGLEYLRVQYEVFRDVRFVATPPESIGKFGYDTDNWMWPRHTGDFSVWRVYANADNHAADYSPDNRPYRPERHLQISMKGAHPGDYTMVVGFPGTTERYISSWGVAQMRNIENRERIDARQIKLDILQAAMRADQATYIDYASKYASSSNYWKNAIGMNQSIDSLDVIGRKRAEEADFAKQAGRKGAALLAEMADNYARLTPWETARDVWNECLWSGPELLRHASAIKWAAIADQSDSLRQDNIRNKARKFCSGYRPELDCQVAAALCQHYLKRLNDTFPPDGADRLTPPDFRGHSLDSIPYIVKDIYNRSVLTDTARLWPVVEAARFDSLLNDPAVTLIADLLDIYNNSILAPAEHLDNALSDNNRLYLALRRKLWGKERKVYPDANFTKRLTYGHVRDYSSGNRHFDYYTNAQGILDKEDAASFEFQVDPELKTLINQADFGPYADKDGQLHVCFITTNDITGGNSGSPVLDADGKLIGLAFDGNWEAMSGDIIFEPTLQRCICVDIRYVLFVLDRLGHMEWLLDEIA